MDALSNGLIVVAALGALWGAVYWLVDVRTRLSAHAAELAAIREWIGKHEAFVEKQIELFQQVRAEIAAIRAVQEQILARLDRGGAR